MTGKAPLTWDDGIDHHAEEEEPELFPRVPSATDAATREDWAWR